ncbi:MULTISPECIES: histidine kinase [unclassified Rhizobacter]|uniref:histidine kinase n=1 Tax=unclassified Rhizobacter TaxID=2640088 RepID=UPI0009E8B63E|nr:MULTISPECIES: histidine kinase [unclassified Rhizobacter]
MVSSPTPPAAPGFTGSMLPAARRTFSAYARWLDSISWKRFIVLSVLALIASGILSDLPPFNLRWTDDRIMVKGPKRKAPAAPSAPASAASSADGSKHANVTIAGKPFEVVIDDKGVRIGPLEIDDNGVRAGGVTIDDRGVRIGPGAPAAAASAAASAASGITISVPSIEVKLPKNADTEAVRAAVEEAKADIQRAIAEAQEAAVDAQREAADRVLEKMAADDEVETITIKGFRPGDHLPGFTFLLIFISMIIKIMAAGRFKAEAQAVVATEMAESEALKRQVIEARMAAMQAQVEPHFLFNTLASIDHLIETDPPRASRMQKNLIALLRASMPTMREANAQATRDLGRELAVIRPYLEILKVRMEERLQTEVRVSDGLLSAEFPPMMLQSLVENAIKHGLEPKAEGGSLTVGAEIVHGKLAVTVADTGLGFGKAATAGTGIGLANIRERLQLLYGSKASLTVAENPGGGTLVTITVPYRSKSAEGASA